MRNAVRAGIAVFGLVGMLGLAACHGGRASRDSACEPPAPCAPAAAPVADLPPDAACGEVWCKYWVPPVVATERHSVLCREASCERVTAPPLFDTITRPTCVCPPERHCIEVPAQYEWVTEKVLVEPARVEKRMVPGCGPLGFLNMECRDVGVPARIETRCRKICIRPQHWRYEWSCGTSGQESRRECVRSAWVNDVPVPAQCKTVETCREVAPGRMEWRKNDHCQVPAPCPPPPCAPPPCVPACPPPSCEPCDPCAAPGATDAPPVVRSTR